MASRAEETRELKALIAEGESDRVEFKQTWWDLEHAEGKARLAKSVLALANTVREGESGVLVCGVSDAKKIVGVDKDTLPKPETISNIIGSYVQPPATVRCRHVRYNSHTLSLITVDWSAARPHYAVRQHEGVLSTNVVYVRRDRTTGVLTIPEMEAMIREKDRYGTFVSREPIQFGFIELVDASSSGGAIVARVANLTAEPLGGVTVTFDVRNARNPELFHRARTLVNATLGPGEARDVNLRLNQFDFYVARFDAGAGATSERTWHSIRDFGRYLGDRWLDVTLHVDYRDRDGLIQHGERRISIES